MSYEDALVTVYPVDVSSTKTNQSCLSYIVIPKAKPKFDVSRARLFDGLQMSQHKSLVLGQQVTLESGQVVKPEDVMVAPSLQD